MKQAAVPAPPISLTSRVFRVIFPFSPTAIQQYPAHLRQTQQRRALSTGSHMMNSGPKIAATPPVTIVTFLSNPMAIFPSTNFKSLISIALTIAPTRAIPTEQHILTRSRRTSTQRSTLLQPLTCIRELKRPQIGQARWRECFAFYRSDNAKQPPSHKNPKFIQSFGHLRTYRATTDAMICLMI